MNDNQKQILGRAIQIALALVFLFSGYAKVIDPLGGWYKFDDYLTAFSWESMKTISFVLSCLLSMAEFGLGVLLLINCKARLTACGVLAFMAIMLPLTLYIAINNPVTDCGCFGEALKISNWATFWKNVVFTSLAIALLHFSRYLEPKECDGATIPLMGWARVSLVAAYTLCFLTITTQYCLKYLPIVDFRPYYVGQKVIDAMAIPEGAELDEYDTYLTYVHPQHGVREVKFNTDEYTAISADTMWVCTGSRSELIKKGYEPPIHDFTLEHPDMGDITEEVLMDESKYTFLCVMKRVETEHFAAEKEETAAKLEDLYAFCQSSGCSLVLATATGVETDEMTDFKATLSPDVAQGLNVVNTDEITLKTIVRSCPGFVLLKGQEIIGKWSHEQLPNFEAESEAAGGDVSKMPSMQKQEWHPWLASIVFFALFFGLFGVADYLLFWRKKRA